MAGRALLGRFAGVRRDAPPPEMRLPAARVSVPVLGLDRDLGVTLLSSDGSRDLRSPPVLLAALADAVDLGRGAEASDMGGDGGSCTAAVDRGLASGGVVMSGELAVELGDASTFLSNVGEPSADRSVEMTDRWRDSCFLILACISSASILSSASSSRSRCDSMRSFSRSCSPDRISSSIKTARSMAWLYFDSMSSSDDVVLRA